MHEQGLVGIQRRKFCITSDANHELPIADNYFTAAKANQKWGIGHHVHSNQ